MEDSLSKKISLFLQRFSIKWDQIRAYFRTGPKIRNALVNEMLSDPKKAESLLKAIEKERKYVREGKVPQRKDFDQVFVIRVGETHGSSASSTQ